MAPSGPATTRTNCARTSSPTTRNGRVTSIESFMAARPPPAPARATVQNPTAKKEPHRQVGRAVLRSKKGPALVNSTTHLATTQEHHGYAHQQPRLLQPQLLPQGVRHHIHDPAGPERAGASEHRPVLRRNRPAIATDRAESIPPPNAVSCRPQPLRYDPRHPLHLRELLLETRQPLARNPIRPLPPLHRLGRDPPLLHQPRDRRIQRPRAHVCPANVSISVRMAYPCFGPSARLDRIKSSGSVAGPAWGLRAIQNYDISNYEVAQAAGRRTKNGN